MARFDGGDISSDGGSILPRLTSVDRGAAIWLQRARAPGARERSERMRLLGSAAALRLWENDPAGARWRTATNYCPPCGMGFTPEISRHFLDFYAADQR